ncbi:MAG: sialidase family protein [Chloroflexota bacterium]
MVIVGLGQTAVGATAVAAPETADHFPDWNEPIPLTTVVNAPFGASRPVVAAAPSGPTVTVVFNRQMSNDLFDNDPWFTRSINNGATWSPPTSIFSGTANSQQPTVVIDVANRAHAAWREGTALVYAAEEDWGSNRIQFLSVPLDPPGVTTPAIAAGASGVLAIVWAEGSGGNPDIHFTRSGDGGQSWEMSRPVLTTPSSSLFPDVVVDANNVLHLVWEENDKVGEPGQPVQGTVYYSHSTAMGWSEPVSLSDIKGMADAHRPTILLTNQGVEVAFVGQGAGVTTVHHVYCNGLCDSGLSWQTTPPVSAGFTYQSDIPIIPTLGRYQGCALVYIHGVRTDIPAEMSGLWGSSRCGSWQQQERQILPPDQALAPQLVNQGSQWSYLTYESVGITNQIMFLRNQFKMFLPYVGCAIDAPPDVGCGALVPLGLEQR